jgi:endonuclease/exonuclease/phosphatase family metal-dependent hydrolase
MVSRRRLKKYGLWGLGLLIGLTAGWYITVRLISPFKVVQSLQIEPATAPNASPSFETLRVGCFNIAHGRGGKLHTPNWHGDSRDEKQIRLNHIAQLLIDAQLDIVVLNEVDFSSFWSGHIDQSVAIARRAGYPYIVQQRNVDLAIPGMSLRFGNAILSRYPLSDAAFLDFPNPSLVKKLFIGGIKDSVAATATLPDGSQVNIVAVHLSLEGETVRNASVEIIRQFYRESKLPMIVMGDFNSTARGLPGHRTDPDADSCIDTLLADPHFQTLRQETNDLTFPSQNPSRTIDWIFVTPPWHIRDKTVIQTNLSDHLPVTMTLTKQSSEQ